MGLPELAGRGRRIGEAIGGLVLTSWWLVFSGLFDEHPKLKIILGHLGEGLPFAMHRLNDSTCPRPQRSSWRQSRASRAGLRLFALDHKHVSWTALSISGRRYGIGSPFGLPHTHAEFVQCCWRKSFGSYRNTLSSPLTKSRSPDSV